MYDKELVFIDSIMDVLMPEIRLVEEEINVPGQTPGAEELTDGLEHKLCVCLTREASVSAEVQQRLKGKSLDARKMMAFLKISCSEYLNLKNILKNKDIHNAYYDTRIAGRPDASIYKLFTCLNLLGYMVTELDATEAEAIVKAEAEVIVEAEKALNTLNSTAQHLSDLQKMLSARVADGILSNADPSVVKLLALLKSLRTISNILESGFEARQAFIKDLGAIIGIARASLENEEQIDSEQSGFRRGIYLRLHNEAQEILEAIHIAYPNDATLTPLAVEKESESEEKLAFEEPPVIEEKQEGEIFMVNRDKQEIDCFLNGVKAQPRAIFMPSYSRCIKELTKRHEVFSEQYSAASDNKSMLIQQFIKDVLKIIDTKMNESSAIIGNSREALLRLQKDFLETIKTIHQPSASSSSSNSPPSSLFFRQLLPKDDGDEAAASRAITFKNAGSEE